MPGAASEPRQEARRRRESRGRLAEAIAALWLRARGYRILRRRLRTPVGEIDILAQRKGILAVIEVKARDSVGDAMASLTPRQRQRIVRAAAWYMAQIPRATEFAVRFDLIVVRPLRLPLHIESAWTADRDARGPAR